MEFSLGPVGKYSVGDGNVLVLKRATNLSCFVIRVQSGVQTAVEILAGGGIRLEIPDIFQATEYRQASPVARRPSRGVCLDNAISRLFCNPGYFGNAAWKEPTPWRVKRDEGV